MKKNYRLLAFLLGFVFLGFSCAQGCQEWCGEDSNVDSSRACKENFLFSEFMNDNILNLTSYDNAGDDFIKGGSFVADEFVLDVYQKILGEIGGKSSRDVIPIVYAVQKGLEVSPDLRSAVAIKNHALSEVSMAENGYYPAFEASVGPDHGVSGEIGYNLSISQSIFDWGLVARAVDGAKALYRKEKYEVEKKKNDVAFEVVQAYLDLQKSRDIERSLIAHRANLEEILNIVESRASAKYSDNIELGRIKQAIAYNAEQSSSEMANLSDSIDRFSEVTGISPVLFSLNLVLDTSVLDEISLDDDFNDYVLKSPQVKSTNERVLKALSDVKVAEAAEKPKLVFQANVHRREIGGEMVNDSSLGFRIKMDFMQGGAAFQRANAQRYKLEEAKWEADSVRKEIGLKVKYIKNQRQSLLGRIVALKDQYEISCQLRDNYLEQFLVGMKGVDDLIKMEHEKFEISRKILLTINEYQVLPFRISLELGVLPSVLGVDGGILGEL